MFQRKIGEMFKEQTNVFGTVDDILVVRYEGYGKNNDGTL